MHNRTPTTPPNRLRRCVLQLGSLCLLAGARDALHAAPSREAPLQYRVFTARRPGLNRDVPPGKEPLEWVSNSATLIYGQRDAILVDSFLTVQQCGELARDIAATNRVLKGIYVTHAHGDHFLGLQVLQSRFPQTQAWATPEVVAGVRRQSTPEKLDGRWRKLFPGQIAAGVPPLTPVPSDTLELEGNVLAIHRLGHTDTDDSTCLHVPSIGLVVAGDAVYNGIHPFLVESTRRNRPEWIAALDQIAALHPKAVVAGHKNPDRDDDPACVAATRRYIEDFIRLDAQTATARELYDRMLALYPDWVNPGSLWSSSIAAKAEGQTEPGKTS